MQSAVATAPWWLTPVSSLLAVILGAWIAFHSTRAAQRRDLLNRHRMELLLVLEPLELNAKDFEKAAERIPLLYEASSPVILEYAYYRTKARGWGGGLYESHYRRRIVDAIADSLDFDMARPHRFEAIAKDFETRFPDQPMTRDITPPDTPQKPRKRP